jgi:PIN domain nuclease of toxin-antitoxin system
MGDAGLILLDTQAIIWLEAADPRLGAEARVLIDRALSDGELAISAISFCEIAWLLRAGRVTLPLPPAAWRISLLAAGLSEIPLDGEIAIAAVALADFHKDPADRLIVATALDEGARLVTSDAKILAWPGPLARIDARQ